MSAKRPERRRRNSRLARLGRGLKAILEKPFNAVKDVFEYLGDHDWGLYSAGLSFYALISLTPFVVLAVIVGGAVFGTERATAELYAAVMSEAGPQVASLVVGFAAGARDATSLSLASVFGLVILLWSSTNLFTQVRSSLHEMWGIDPPASRPGGIGGAIVRFFRYRLFAALGTLVFGALFLALLAMRVALSLVEERAGDFLDVPFWVWDIAEVVTAVIFITLFVRIVYRLLPDRSPRGLGPWIGALLTGLLLILGRTGVATYLTVGNVSSAYGATGALVIFLGWAYWSSYVFLLGARVTYVLAHHWGRWPEPQATPALAGGAEPAPLAPEVEAEASAAGLVTACEPPRPGGPGPRISSGRGSA